MPVIPRISEQRQGSARLPTAQQSTGAPADAFGPDLSGLASEGIKYATRVKEKADTARVMEADSNLMSVSNELLYDPDNGALNARGKNAFGIDDQVLQDFDKRTSEIRQDLTGDQVTAFDKLVSQRKQQIQGTLLRHINSEMSTYESNQYEAMVNGSIETATNNYTDPGSIGLELKRQSAAIMARSRAEGWSPEQESQALEASRSATHGSVIRRMLSDKNYDMAQEYFEATSDQIEGKDRDALAGMVEKGGKLSQAQAQSDRIFAVADDEKTALREAREITDPEIRDDVLSRLRTRYSEQRRLEEQEKADAFKAATDVIEGGGTVGELPPMIQGRLNNKQINALKARQQEIANPTRKNNWQVWTRVSTATREELAQFEDPYVELRPYLDDAHYNKALTLINKAKGIKQAASDEPDVSSSMTFMQQAKNTALLSGILPADKTPSEYTEQEALTFSRFQSEAAARIEERELDQGRKLTGQERQQVMDEMVMDENLMQIEGVFTDTDQFTWAVSQDEQGDAIIPIERIPADDQEFVKNLLRGNGAPPSDDNVQRAYAQYKLGNIEAFQNIIQGR